MAHLGLICPELSGHLNPMTTLGRELKRRGHRVTLIGRCAEKDRVRRP
jgi:zeaxanthin glucosyltransferase